MCRTLQWRITKREYVLISFLIYAASYWEKRFLFLLIDIKINFLTAVTCKCLMFDFLQLRFFHQLVPFDWSRNKKSLQRKHYSLTSVPTLKINEVWMWENTRMAFVWSRWRKRIAEKSNSIEKNYEIRNIFNVVYF